MNKKIIKFLILLIFSINFIPSIASANTSKNFIIKIYTIIGEKTVISTKKDTIQMMESPPNSAKQVYYYIKSENNDPLFTFDSNSSVKVTLECSALQHETNKNIIIPNNICNFKKDGSDYKHTHDFQLEENKSFSNEGIFVNIETKYINKESIVEGRYNCDVKLIVIPL